MPIEAEIKDSKTGQTAEVTPERELRVTSKGIDRLIASEVGLTKGINEKWFEKDLNPIGLENNQGTEFKIHFSIDVISKVSYTIDGTKFVDLEVGSDLNLNSGYVYNIPVKKGDAFNIRAEKALAVTFVRVRQL